MTPSASTRPLVRRAVLAVAVLAVLLGQGWTGGPATATTQETPTTEETTTTPPATAPPATTPPSPAEPEDAGPEIVTVGTYIQNLSDVDLKAGTLRADFYLWFRWRGAIDPTLTYEFTNSIPQELSSKAGSTTEDGTPLAETLADGQKIQVFHVQGKFVHPFRVDDFPLDAQDLVISIEDLRYDETTLVYEVDPTSEYRADLSIIGWEPRRLDAKVVPNRYTTNFGYPGGENAVFSHVDFGVHVERTGASRIFEVVFPLVVIILIALMALVIDPPSLDACLFLAPPALIAAVALHFTATTGLPSEGRVLLIDKIYLLSYLVILMVLGFGVFSHRQRDRGRAQLARTVDRTGLLVLTPLFLVGTFLLIAFR
jgi:hypothetical protein